RAADRAGGARDRPGRAPGDPRRRTGAPHADRVRPAAAPRGPAARRPGPRGLAGAGLGLVARLGDAHRRQPREGPPTQARRGPDPHRARRRLRIGGATVVTVADRAAALADLLPRPL